MKNWILAYIVWPIIIAAGFYGFSKSLESIGSKDNIAIFCADSRHVTVMTEVEDAQLGPSGINWKEKGHWYFYQKKADEACMTLDKLPTIPASPPAQEKQGLNIGPKEED